MSFYLINFGMFLTYSAILHAAKRDKYVWWISLIQFALIAMLRDEHIGADTGTYCNVYMNMGRTNSLMQIFQAQMGGISLLFWPLRQILPYRWVWMVLSGLIPTVCVWIFVRDYSPNPFLSIYFYITCYYYFQAMNAGRQAIAMGFALMALSLIYKKHYLRSLIFSVAAILVHAGGAFVILLAYPVFMVHWTPKRYLIALGGSVLTSAAFIVLQNVFTRLFSYYENYSYTSWQSRGRMFWIYLLIAFFVVYAVLILIQKNKGRSVVRGFMPCAEYTDNSGTQVVWGNAVLITFQLALCMILNRMLLVSRVTSLYMWLYILFIPQILSYKTRIRNIVMCVMMVGMFGQMLFRLSGNYSIICPYSTFLG